MALLFSLIIGTFSPDWGHTWITRDNGKIYSLKSLPGGSSLLVYEYCDTESDGGPVFFTDHSKNLKLLGEYKTSGKHSCHITILKKQAILSDYTSGTLSIFNLDKDGVPYADARTISFPRNTDRKSYNPERQETSHIHSSWISLDKKYLVVVDLGMDRLYRFEIKKGEITDNYDILNLPDGCGPRHCVFVDNNLYISTELSDEVLVYSWPSMELLQRCNTNKQKPQGGSHIAISPDKQFLYVSSRLQNDGLSIFKIQENGLLKEVGYQCTGSHPRHFSISEDGKNIAVACRDNDVIEIYSINQDNGLLSKENTHKIQRPVYVDFINSKKHE